MECRRKKNSECDIPGGMSWRRIPDVGIPGWNGDATRRGGPSACAREERVRGVFLGRDPANLTSNFLY